MISTIRMRFRVRVYRWVQMEDGRWQVHTHKGSITANKIINCGGLWAREVRGLHAAT